MCGLWLLNLLVCLSIQGLIALSLCGNKIDNVEVVVEEVSKLKNLRALWLNNNPVVENWYECVC